MQRAELSDYKGSGYDRGHIVPAVDMKRNFNGLKESYLLSNVVPQNPNCNRGIWRILEGVAREMAMKYGEVWIITGVVVGGGESKNARIIGDGVCVPVGLYKIIVYMEGEMVDAVAFLVGNKRRTGVEWGTGIRINVYDYCISIDYIEAITGFDFLNVLPDDVEERAESQVCK